MKDYYIIAILSFVPFLLLGQTKDQIQLRNKIESDLNNFKLDFYKKSNGNHLSLYLIFDTNEIQIQNVKLRSSKIPFRDKKSGVTKISLYDRDKNLIESYFQHNPYIKSSCENEKSEFKYLNKGEQFEILLPIQKDIHFVKIITNSEFTDKLKIVEFDISKQVLKATTG